MENPKSFEECFKDWTLRDWTKVYMGVFRTSNPDWNQPIKRRSDIKDIARGAKLTAAHVGVPHEECKEIYKMAKKLAKEEYRQHNEKLLGDFMRYKQTGNPAYLPWDEL